MGQTQGQANKKFFYPNGDSFEGEFVNNLREGQGIYVSKAGHRYEGGWKKDQREGNGSLTFVEKEDGVTKWAGTYEGEWHLNRKHGRGTFTYPSGDKYEGGWADDQKEGYGIYYYMKEKDRYEGYFSKGNMHGSGVIVYATGDQLVGKWLDDQLDGRALFTSSTGLRREEFWEHGTKISSRELKEEEQTDIDIDINSSSASGGQRFGGGVSVNTSTEQTNVADGRSEVSGLEGSGSESGISPTHDQSGESDDDPLTKLVHMSAKSISAKP